MSESESESASPVASPRFSRFALLESGALDPATKRYMFTSILVENCASANVLRFELKMVSELGAVSTSS
jgi:hypothetical protein